MKICVLNELCKSRLLRRSIRLAPVKLLCGGQINRSTVEGRHCTCFLFLCFMCLCVYVFYVGSLVHCLRRASSGKFQVGASLSLEEALRGYMLPLRERRRRRGGCGGGGGGGGGAGAGG